MLAAAAAAVCTAAPAAGQIVTDGTVGPTQARTGPNFVVPDTLGQRRGPNLFHSFSQFNIHSGETATFTAGAGGPGEVPVHNVIARVTGGQPSEVNGLLRSAIPDANFFLVNPSGVVLGPEAQLDVGGSFVVTTASYVKLSDGTRFSAVAPQRDTALSTAPPTAFGFLPSASGSSAAGAITYTVPAMSVRVPALSVPQGRSLSVIGRAVHITGGRFQSIGGQVNVVAVGGAGEVGLDADNPAAVPDVSAVKVFAPVELSDAVSSDGTLSDDASLRGPSGGRVVVRAGGLSLARSSINIDTSNVPGGGIDIVSTGPVTLTNGSISAQTTGPEDSGAIRIAAPSVSIAGRFTDGSAAISAGTTSAGRGGDISLDVGSLSITVEGSIQALTDPGTTGRGGDIRVNATRSVRIDGTGSTAN